MAIKVQGINAVPQEALRFLKNKSREASFRWGDVYAEEHAASFTAAGATKLDILQAIHDELGQAIAKGTPFNAWKKDLAPRLAKLGWWGETEVEDPKHPGQKRTITVNPHRLKTIYDSNLRSAYAAGQWERAQRTKGALPYFLYELGPSREHRKDHAAWAGTVLPVDDQWWASHMPPNGWGCKCRVRQITRSEAAAKGYAPTARPAAEGQTKEFLNKSTGELRNVPVGIDPGWESNPGQVRQENLGRLLADKLDKAPGAVAEAALRDYVDSDVFEQIVMGMKKQFTVPAIRIDPALAESAGARRSIFSLSRGTMEKQLREHPELSIAEYRQLPEMGTDPGLVVRQGNSLVVVRYWGRNYYVTVVKATATGEGAFVTSFRRLAPPELKRLRKSGEVLIDKYK